MSVDYSSVANRADRGFTTFLNQIGLTPSCSDQDLDNVIQKFMDDLTILTHAFISVDGREINNHTATSNLAYSVTGHMNGRAIAINKCTQEVSRFLLRNFFENVCELAQDEN